MTDKPDHLLKKKVIKINLSKESKTDVHNIQHLSLFSSSSSPFLFSKKKEKGLVKRLIDRHITLIFFFATFYM